MYVLIVIALASEIVAQSPLEYSINVGTVLFSPSDLHRTHWSSNDLSLLKARRHFQDLLPPPNFIDTSNGDYVNVLLNYFKDTYSTIKREATCPISDSLMTTALSDALGGYMKLWVLPISKLAFYAGTVSQENLIKLYQFHNEIEKFVETDGSGWRSPDKKLLNSITVNIAPPAHITRNVRNPCEKIAYYEKTGETMSIPTPYIDWGDTKSTMFLPLRNKTLIPLDSPNYSNALFQYYDTAKNCIDSSNTDQNAAFDERFQTWLTTDVLPHLTDDTIYLPLGSVLSLVNSSQKMYDKVSDLYAPKPKIKLPTHYVIAGIPIDLSSKKTLFIGIILILEIAWCIPALLYILFSRRKKPKTEGYRLNTLLDACRNRRRGGDFSSNKTSSKGFKLYKGGSRGFKIGNRPRSENLELETQFIPSDSMATDTRSYFGSGVCSGVSVIHETKPTPPLKSSMKKIRSTNAAPEQHTININSSKSKRTCCSPKKLDDAPVQTQLTELSIRTESYTIENDPDPSTAFSSVKQINLPTESTTTQHRKSACIIKKSKSKSFHQCKEELPSDCPCLTCLEAEVGSEITVVNQESHIHQVCSDKIVEIDMEPLCPLIDQAKLAKKTTKKVGLRIESGRPYLEIMIDKPQAEICVGIGGTFDPLKVPKRSKIPKRCVRATGGQQTSCTSPMVREPMTHRNKSLIPQPKRRPVDDSVIKSSKLKQKRSDKLNVTL